jgi:hypothetical protein
MYLFARVISFYDFSTANNIFDNTFISPRLGAFSRRDRRENECSANAVSARRGAKDVGVRIYRLTV